jgi:tRNA1Val (adenine37-N6)-methyltransferase
MSTINLHYTFNYSQPKEYRLSHDSVFLSRQVFEQLGNIDLTNASALDVCAGAGIVGMDFLFHRRKDQQSLPANFDFLEIQDCYVQHFNENQRRLGDLRTRLNFLLCNYNDLKKSEFRQKYDLILSAPPYFLAGHGKLSPSEFKNRCRFFIDSDLRNLLLGIHNSLKNNGTAFLLLRDLPEHGINILSEAETICKNLMQLTVLGDIRGTHFVKLRTGIMAEGLVVGS